ncbi:MAG: PspA-associated protein PspAB [Acidimicrobiales bacterium]
MGLLDTLLGRTKPAQANLDALFALPSASITLESAAGMTASGRSGVCYKPPTGQGFEDMQAEVMKLLAMDNESVLSTAEDRFGYHWVVVENRDIESLVTQVHLINSSLSDAGWGPQLLCSVFGVAPLPVTEGSGTGTPAGRADVMASETFLVYLFKRGTFYPFAPDGREHRNTERELKLKSLVSGDLAIEPDLDRWFPLWELPVG